MSYYAQTAEGNMGRQIELYVREWYRHAGWIVIPMYAIQDGGAPMALGHVQRNVLPDLQMWGPAGPRWVEVKSKNRANFFAKLQRYDTGIDLDLWPQYLKVEASSGIPGYLAIVHVRLQADHPIKPFLCIASFDDLRTCGRQDPTPRPHAPHGMIYWDVDAFEKIWLPGLPTADLPNLEPRRMRVWEQKRSIPTGERWSPGLRQDRQGTLF